MFRRWIDVDGLGGQKVSLDELPRHLLVHSILLSHCTGADVRALASSSKRWWNGLENEDDLWRALYENRGVRFPRCPPSFPSCGTWRDVYLRSIRFESLVIVRTLTRPKENMRLVLSRTTPLYGLKREIRERQRLLDGVAFEDFELRDLNSKVRLGVAGNDSLPPADLRRLFWMDLGNSASAINASIARFGVGAAGEGDGHLPHVGASYRAAMFTGSVDGWRVSLTSISDGATFEQVFVNSHASFSTGTGPALLSQPGLLDAESRIATYEKELNNTMPDVEQVNKILEKSSKEMSGMGPTAFKTFWRESSVHPLLKLALDSGLPWSKRLISLFLFGRQSLRTILRTRFLMDVFVNAVLTNGFPLSFLRLSLEIFPMVWRTQIKQMLEADFDFGFALRLIRDVVKATSNAFVPVARSAMKVELGRALMKLIFTWESPREDLILNSLAVFADLLAHRSVLFRPPDVVLLWDAIVDYLSSSTTVSYACSSALWGLFERRTESALSVTLPLYFYALPVIACAVVLRARVFLAQSYVSLLLA